MPFEGMNPMQMGFAVGSQGYRPPLPADAPPGLTDLISSCWQDEPQQRPTFSQVLHMLQALEVKSKSRDSLFRTAIHRPRKSHAVYNIE